jgi:ubiquinone/menaquinone biosynthesis C-methylase UbiE
MESQADEWNSVYKQQEDRKQELQEEVIALHDLFRNNKVQRILDLGCGNGRYLVHFAKLGYTLSGIDIALEAIKQITQRLADENLQADLQCADMIQLSWPNNYFDAVLSIRVIEHNLLPSMRKIVKEGYRVIKDGGYFFINIKKYPPWEDWKGGKFTRIDHHLYAPTEGPEKGILHYFFTKAELDLFADFAMITLDEDKRHQHYYVLLKKNTP